MATHTFDKIEYGGNTYVVSDSGALQLTGGQVTGPVTFGDSVSIDEATIGDLVVNGSASFTNNIQANTINGVTVGSSPKFTDTVTTISTTGSGNAVTAISASNGVLTATKGTTFLTSHQTIKQDGVTGATGNHFGTCSVAAGTAAKTVSITAGTPALEAGLRVTVKFSNANTAGTPTLNVNSLGAKNIFHNGAQITTGANKALLAGTVEFVYDGTQWQLVGNYIDTDTKAWSSITGKPTSTGSSTAGITASTTATTTTVGSHSTDYGVKSAGSGSFTQGSFTGGSLVVTNHVLSFTPATHGTDSHTHTAPTLGSKVPTVSTTSATVSITDNGHTHPIN